MIFVFVTLATAALAQVWIGLGIAFAWSFDDDYKKAGRSTRFRIFAFIFNILVAPSTLVWMLVGVYLDVAGAFAEKKR